MAEERVQRRLAAILAADIVGYTRLMEADEAATLARMKAMRSSVLDPSIERFGGRVFKTTGDGILIEFQSAVAAVELAVEVQRALAERDADLSEGQRLELRIGISVGDVIVDGDDLFGTGVNLAARLEGLAEPGGICVSGTVRDQVRGALDLAFDDIGPQSVKNIAEPVPSFLLRPERRASAPAAPAVAAKAPSAADGPSIAVLPFDNMSSDPEQEYFSDGISEDVITDLSKVSGLLVIARNSSFVYKGRAVGVKQVADELGVQHVLEGSVRKAGNRVRVNAQLIEAATGGHVWAERYDRSIDDIFAVQDELTREIVGALKVHLTQGDRDRLRARTTVDPEAYDLFLRARELVWLHTRVEGQTGQALLRQAIALAPEFGKAHAILSFAHSHEFVSGWGDDPDASLRLARELADKAVSLEPADAECHWALGVVLMWRREHDKSLEESARCIALEPNSTMGHAHRGITLVYAGRPAEALEIFARMRRLDPHFPDLFLHFIAQAHFGLEHYEDAEAVLRQRNVRNPNSEMTRVLLASALGHLGRSDEAHAEWSEALRINPSYSLEQRRKILPFKDPADFERMVAGLGKAGLPE